MMDAKANLRMRQLAVTLKNSEEKIKSYTAKISKTRDSKKRQEYQLRKEIEQLRIEMKKREAKIIQLKN